MYSAGSTLAGGFPHSDIPGSKLYCQLPEAFRRLTRPSSPVAAKASTMCAWSLDPITLKHHHLINFDFSTNSTKQQHRVIGVYENLIRQTFNLTATSQNFHPAQSRYVSINVSKIQSSPMSTSRLINEREQTSSKFLKNKTTVSSYQRSGLFVQFTEQESLMADI